MFGVNKKYMFFCAAALTSACVHAVTKYVSLEAVFVAHDLHFTAFYRIHLMDLTAFYHILPHRMTFYRVSTGHLGWDFDRSTSTSCPDQAQVHVQIKFNFNEED